MVIINLYNVLFKRDLDIQFGFAQVTNNALISGSLYQSVVQFAEHTQIFPRPHF